MATIPHVTLAFGDLPKKLKEADGTVPVDRDVLLRLLDLYITCWDFDEHWYLLTNPDVTEAVKAGVFESGWVHFRKVGYLEGRFGSNPTVDAEWYIENYPDVALGIVNGTVTSPQDHFIRDGHFEGRLPANPEIHPIWYIPRYLPSANPRDIDKTDLLNHFLTKGYRQLAVPTPPR